MPEASSIASLFSRTISGGVSLSPASIKTIPRGLSPLLSKASTVRSVWLIVPNPARAAITGVPFVNEIRSATNVFLTTAHTPPAAFEIGGMNPCLLQNGALYFTEGYYFSFISCGKKGGFRIFKAVDY